MLDSLDEWAVEFGVDVDGQFVRSVPDVGIASTRQGPPASIARYQWHRNAIFRDDGIIGTNLSHRSFRTSG